MPKQDVFSRAASFEDALRKFEEALRQNQETSSGAPAPPAGGTGPQVAAADAGSGQEGQPDWSRPADAPGYGVIGETNIGEPDNPYPNDSSDRSDFLRRTAAAAEAFGGQPGSEGYASEGSIGPDLTTPQGSGATRQPGEGDSRRFGSMGASSFAGSGMEFGDSWWADPSTGAATTAKTGALPAALANLGRYASPLVQGIVWAEVLGKPVSKRQGRGRHGI